MHEVQSFRGAGLATPCCWIQSPWPTSLTNLKVSEVASSYQVAYAINVALRSWSLL